MNKQITHPRSRSRRAQLWTLFGITVALCVLNSITANAQVNQESTYHYTLFDSDAHAVNEAPMLDHYLKTALQNHQGLRAAFERWQAAVDEAPQARALPNPRLEVELRALQSQIDPQNSSIMVTQDIPWKSKRTSAEALAELKAESLWWHAAQLKLGVIRDVKRIYYEYAFLAHNIRIHDQNLELLRNLEPVVQARIRGGASQGDLLRLQVEIGLMENEHETLLRFRPALNAQLNALLQDSSSDLEPLPDILPPITHEFSRDDLVTAVDRLNPELVEHLWDIRQAEQNIAISELERKPDFMVGVTYMNPGLSDTAMGFEGGGDSVGVKFGVTIPIWRKKIDAGIRQAQKMEAMERRNLSQRREEFHAELDMLIYQLSDAARQMDLYQESLIPRKQQVMEVIQVEYQSGNANFLDIIDSERELLMLQQSYWRAVSEYAIRLAELEALCGGTLP